MLLRWKIKNNNPVQPITFFQYACNEDQENEKYKGMIKYRYIVWKLCIIITSIMWFLTTNYIDV